MKLSFECDAVGFEDGGRSHQPKNAGVSQKVDTARAMNCPLTPPEEIQHGTPFDFNPAGPLFTADLTVRD